MNNHQLCISDVFTFGTVPIALASGKGVSKSLDMLVDFEKPSDSYFTVSRKTGKHQETSKYPTLLAAIEAYNGITEV